MNEPVPEPAPVERKRKAKARPYRLSVGKALLLAIPMLLIVTLLISGQLMGGEVDPLLVVAAGLTWLMFNAVFLWLLLSGETFRPRSALFITLALAMIVTFFKIITSERGSVSLTEANMIAGETPFCHLVIPSVIVPAIFTGTIIFPGSLLEGFASIASMFVLWIGATIVLGRGWCSWFCFYGGLDEACSRILKKPVIKRIDRRWIYFPFALLLVVVLASAASLSPFYCEWLCPFKTVTEAPAVTSTLLLIQAIIFVALFIGLVVVLPILTRRRIQCGLFCPFGAFQSFTNKLSVFEVRIDPEKCVRCGRCVRECPTFSLDESSLESGRPSITCTRCGQCVDICPQQAISYHVKGTPIHANPATARLLFLYPAFLVLAIVGSGTITYAVWGILKLITTGSLL